jgi:hypothetical protein
MCENIKKIRLVTFILRSLKQYVCFRPIEAGIVKNDSVNHTKSFKVMLSSKLAYGELF